MAFLEAGWGNCLSQVYRLGHFSARQENEYKDENENK